MQRKEVIPFSKKVRDLVFSLRAISKKRDVFVTHRIAQLNKEQKDLIFFETRMFDNTLTVLQRVQAIRLGILNRCDACGKPIPEKDRQVCSVACVPHSRKVIAKKRSTCQEKYGTSSQLSAGTTVRESIKKITLKKYGVDVPAKNKKIRQKMRDTLKRNHGVTETWFSEKIREKAKASSLKKYGVENPASSPEIIAKIRATSLERYGTVHPFLAKEVRERRDRAMFEKYGCVYASSSKDLRDKRAVNNLKKYGVENPAATDAVREKLRIEQRLRFHEKYRVSNEAEIILMSATQLTSVMSENDWLVSKAAEKLKCSPRIVDLWCNFHTLLDRVVSEKTGVEADITRYLETLGVTTVKTRKVIKPLELDFYSEETSTAIEFDGVHYHCSNGLFGVGRDKRYHVEKTKQCEQIGIQLFHIFGNEWYDENKQKIWKSMLASHFRCNRRIFARKTEVKHVLDSECKSFLRKNHMQGYCASSVRVGLFYDSTLVCLMTFGSSRFDKRYTWELLRYCSSLGVSVVGGASRLFSAFRRENTGSLVSYANRRWSKGGLYETLGFEKVKETAPGYFYTADYQVLESRQKYQKHKLNKILQEYDAGLSEWQNMQNNGYDRIYDCGNLVYALQE